jgi:hypothetical protein
MNEDFEQRLRARFAEAGEPASSERFQRDVQARIARLSRARRALPPIVAVTAAVAVAILGAPLFVAGAAFVGEASLSLNGALGRLIVSPVGFALGALAVVAAVADAFSDRRR